MEKYVEKMVGQIGWKTLLNSNFEKLCGKILWKNCAENCVENCVENLGGKSVP